MKEKLFLYKDDGNGVLIVAATKEEALEKFLRDKTNYFEGKTYIETQAEGLAENVAWYRKQPEDVRNKCFDKDGYERDLKAGVDRMSNDKVIKYVVEQHREAFNKNLTEIEGGVLHFELDETMMDEEYAK